MSARSGEERGLSLQPPADDWGERFAADSRRGTAFDTDPLPGEPVPPGDFRMSGDHATAREMIDKLHDISDELRCRYYDPAKRGGDPLGRRAWGEVLDAVARLQDRYRHG